MTAPETRVLPAKPTAEIIIAIRDNAASYTSADTAKQIYRAILTAAPAAPAQGPVGKQWRWRLTSADPWTDWEYGEAINSPAPNYGEIQERDLYVAPPSPVAASAVDEDWKDDPASDERWSAGLLYGLEQLCAVLGVDRKAVAWDAATDTLDGDVRSVISSIFQARFGDPSSPNPVADNPAGDPVQGPGQATHRHVKRGTLYRLLGVGKMQASDSWVILGRPIGEDPDHQYSYQVDMCEVAIYVGIDDGSMWVRPREEFEDGRFEVLKEGATDGEA